MSLWNEVAAARLTAGRLWLPQLSLDYMGRDWASFTVPCDFDMDVTTAFTDPMGGAFDAVCDFWVCFPDDWDVDDSYITELRLDIYLEMYYTHSGGPFTVEVRIDSSTDVEYLTTSSAWYNLTHTWTSSIPTGPTNVQIQARSNHSEGESTSVHITRSMGDRGPDSFYQIRLQT